MKLPIIKHLTQFIEENDEDFVIETIETLEHITEIQSITDEEMDLIGELLSNMYAALEVNKLIRDENLSQNDAVNNFMKRVMGSIDN